MPALDIEALDAYLNDHRMGATGALHLVERLAGTDDPLVPTAFFTDLGERIRVDLDDLEELMARLGIDHDTTREAGGWLGEKLSRVRLSETVTGSPQLSHLLEAEAVALGIQGKQALWESLQQVLDHDDDRLEGIDLASLVERAQRQFQEVQDHRLAMARSALTTG